MGNYSMKTFVLNYFHISFWDFSPASRTEELHIASAVSALLTTVVKKYSQQLRFLRTTTALDKRY